MSDARVDGDRWQRAKELFADAVARPPIDRSRFLANACADDEALRREVEALLDAHQAAGDLFDRPLALPASLALTAIGAPPQPLAPGRRLGRYEIVDVIGQGGMGQVYRAHDSRLARDVALKVLPPSLAGDAVLRERFVQEARAASALEHPHIAVIHEIAEIDGVPFIAMELVRGEPLAAVVAHGGLRASRALDLAIEIGEALARAHETGIVHRDLKPANVIVTDEGHAKIIDFGLARLLDRGDGGVETHAGTLTESGTLLGTVSYMSPEQTRGSRVDHRSDIFSFGIVLYEMLSGSLPFHGRTRVDTMHAILHDAAPLLPASVGPSADDLQRIVEKCLEKDPADRYQGMRDVVVDLRGARRRLESSHFRVSAAGPADVARRRRSRAIYYGAAAAALIVGVAALVVARRAAPTGGTDRAQWQQVTNLDFATQPAVSPDGRMLTFVRGSGTFTTDGQIYVKPMPDGAAVPLTHDASVKMGPVFSPDGLRVAYTVEARPWATWIVPVLRGEPRLWLTNVEGLTWAGPDRVLFSTVTPRSAMSIATSRENRAEVRDVYVPPHQLGMAHRSYASPDGRSVLVVEMDERGAWVACRLVPFDGSSRGRTVGPTPAQCTAAAWSPDGAWMYFSAKVDRGFHLWRQRYPDGVPEELTSGPTEEDGVAVMPDGRSVITSVGMIRRGVLVHAPSGDREFPLEGSLYWPLLSADGRTLCYRVMRSVATGQTPSELWVIDVDTGVAQRLLEGMLVTGYDLSRDNHVVAAVAGPSGGNELWLASLNPREPPQRIGTLRGDNPRFGSGDEIVFRGDEESRSYLFKVRRNGSGLERLMPIDTNVFGTTSPDGRWMSYSDREGLWLASTRHDAPILVLPGRSVSRIRWSADGSTAFVSFQVGDASAFALGRTYVIPLKNGAILPPVPAGGFRTEADLAKLPGARVLEYADVAPGPNADIYGYSQTTSTRNLYRIPLR